MPGRKIPLITGEYYHVFNRGVNKRAIFQGDKTYQMCLNRMNYYRHQDTPLKFSSLIKLKPEVRDEIWKKVLKGEKYVEILAYCLMPNHFHLLMKQNTEGGIAKFMSKFQNSYSRYFNTKTERSGPLLTGKFKAVKIETDEQLIHVSRYIHLNPITASLVKKTNKLRTYKWSSLNEYYCDQPQTITSPQKILEFFKTRKSYSKFLTDQIDYQRQLHLLKQLVLE